MKRAAPEVLAIASKLRAIGVSGPYASQLARHDRRPSRAMALRIFRGTGLRLGGLVGATKREIALLEKFEH